MFRIGVICILGFAAAAMAQETDSTAGEGGPQAADSQEVESVGGRGFADDVFENVRNRFGFSLNAYQAYTTNTSENEPSGISAIMPRVFFNAGRRKSQLHVDMGAGYRHYNGHSALNSWDYSGNAQYQHRFSRRTIFQLTDQFTSSFNDSWSFVSLSSPIRYDSGFSNEVLFNRQRITRNAMVARLEYRATRNLQVGVFGGFNYYEYPQSGITNTNAFEVGGSLDYKLTEWLHFNNRYSTYLNYVDDRFRDNRIHRLQVAGLDFRLSRSWSVQVSGGVELLDDRTRMRFGESASGAITYTSRPTTFSLGYTRGFTSAIGLSRTMISDRASASLGRRFNRWLSANLQSYYYRSSELDGIGVLETLSCGGGLQFALTRSLIATANSYYQDQKTRNFPVPGLGLDRVSSYVGLQYVWPSLSRSAD